MRLALKVSWLALVMLCANSYAQQYPVKPVRMIIPFTPGGPTDIFGRMVAQRLSQAFGQQVIADNRPGAGGNLGVELAAKSPPDGYTLTMFTVAQSISPSVYTKLGFDPVKDLEHITLVALIPSILMTHPALPAKNVKELVALAKARPGQLAYASTGNGTSPHILMEMFIQMTGIKLIHVPYKGASPALIDQIAGQVQLAFNSAVGALPYVQQGKLKALAVSTKQRFQAMPDLPTVDEAGVKGFDGSSWQGLAAPAGTPKEIIARIHSEVAKMLSEPAVKERILLTLGGIPVGNSPEQFTQFVRSEIAKWAKVAKAANIHLD